MRQLLIKQDKPDAFCRRGEKIVFPFHPSIDYTVTYLVYGNVTRRPAGAPPASKVSSRLITGASFQSERSHSVVGAAAGTQALCRLAIQEMQKAGWPTGHPKGRRWGDLAPKIPKESVTTSGL